MKALPSTPNHPRPYGSPGLLPAFPTEVDAYYRRLIGPASARTPTIISYTQDKTSRRPAQGFLVYNKEDDMGVNGTRHLLEKYT